MLKLGKTITFTPPSTFPRSECQVPMSQSCPHAAPGMHECDNCGVTVCGSCISLRGSPFCGVISYCQGWCVALSTLTPCLTASNPSPSKLGKFLPEMCPYVRLPRLQCLPRFVLQCLCAWQRLLYMQERPQNSQWQPTHSSWYVEDAPGMRASKGCIKAIDTRTQRTACAYIPMNEWSQCTRHPTPSLASLLAPLGDG